MDDRTFNRGLAEFLIPKFISHYCDNCNKPIKEEEETATFVQHLPSNYILTKVDRRVCLECIPEVIIFKPWNRTVAEMVKELVHEFELKLYAQVWDKVLPWRRVKHI